MSNLNKNSNDTLFPTLVDTVEDDNNVMEIESLCMQCYKQGLTKLLLMEIPYFREVILSSFSCKECGHNNTSIQSGGQIQDMAVKYTLTIKDIEDLNRQIVTSEFSSFIIPHLDFEQPPMKQGDITTIESILSTAIESLELFQPQRKDLYPETGDKVEKFLVRLKALLQVNEQFDIILEDLSGNCYIENPNAPNADNYLLVHHFKRTELQDKEIGVTDQQIENGVKETRHNFQGEVEVQEINLKTEVLMFDTSCSNCHTKCQTNMKVVDIPFFKQIVIMATVCDNCGVKDNEVKSAAGIEDKGKRIELNITNVKDLNRDVLKSDTCSVKIPEFDFELMDGTLGGKFTTLEGLIISIKEQLDSTNTFHLGDSTSNNKMKEFTEKLHKLSRGEMLGIKIILDDPSGNSYLENPFEPEADPELKVVHYERTFEDNDILGLNEMKTENY